MFKLYCIGLGPDQVRETSNAHYHWMWGTSDTWSSEGLKYFCVEVFLGGSIFVRIHAFVAVGIWYVTPLWYDLHSVNSSIGGL